MIEQLMVDADGRFIFRNIPQVKPPNWAYGFDRSIQLAYAEQLERSEYAFQRKIGISAAEFGEKAEGKRRQILEEPRYAQFTNLFTGRHARPFAIVLPQMQAPKQGGLGELLAHIIIPAVKFGYGRQYAERAFVDHRGVSLVGQTETFPDSRQERLIAALAEGPRVLWVFLNCLQGASINAARALIQTLPEEFILGGTLTSGPAMAVYAEIAAASGKCPLYFCAADVFPRGYSPFLRPGGKYVDFADWNDLGSCRGGCSASVAVLA